MRGDDELGLGRRVGSISLSFNSTEVGGPEVLEDLEREYYDTGFAVFWFG